MTISDFDRAMPHVRAKDHAEGEAGRFAARWRAFGPREVLIVQGDPPWDLARVELAECLDALIPAA